MTSIGIIRKINALGRITLPKEFREVFMLEKDKEIEIIATEEGILLKNVSIEVKRILPKNKA